jgi:predicted GH43/DUF377 family glycosyl hydrolase
MKKAQPLGVSRDGDSVALIGATGLLRRQLVFGHGHGRSFSMKQDPPVIVLPMGRKQDIAAVEAPRLSRVLDDSILSYTVRENGVDHLRVAVHKHDEELSVWEVLALNDHLRGSGMVVAEYKHEGQYVLYYGQRHISASFSRNLVAWHGAGQDLISPRKDHFDHAPLKLISVTQLEQGILLLYESTQETKTTRRIMVGASLFASDNPTHQLWRSDEPLWEETSRPKERKRVLGAVVYEQEIVFYLTSARAHLLTVTTPNPYAQRPLGAIRTRLHRFPQNPILSPSVLEWESEAVFNPAAFVDNGRVHLLYRALGPDGVSRIGYASSSDGVHFDERLPYPVYEPSYGIGYPDQSLAHGAQTYNTSANASGGGWAGCEDPRVVVIGGQAYMSFVAFDGWNFIRQALTSISLDDVNKKNWAWRKPVLISHPGQIHKNWVIFPEKINGKYAILHGLSPKIHVDYVDTLDDFDGEKFIDSLPPASGAGYHDDSRKHHWDTRVRGAGAPPIKTAMGWLLLYHANDRRDPGKYKLGAMLLDLEDPTKVLYRASAPILEPEEWYENEGKPGVVYTCGAVIVNENLVVYYGGGDKHIAVARAGVHDFLQALAKDQSIALTPVANLA